MVTARKIHINGVTTYFPSCRWPPRKYTKMPLSIVLLLSAVAVMGGIEAKHRPNVCKNFIDYYNMNSENCWYNPDVDADAEEIIKNHGYPFEEYEAATQDGYLLTVFRIPKEKPRGIVFLQHPASTSCTGWIDKGNDSLGFMLWEDGYDVWLGNFRGNYYSRKHQWLNPNQQPFWNFSFHEMGLYDIPAQLDVVANITNAPPQGISLVGFSMGSTAALVYACQRPEHSARLLNVLVLMAPSAYVKNLEGFVKHIGKSADNILLLAQRFNFVEIIARNEFFHNIQSVCRNAPMMVMCMVMDLIIFGNVPAELRADWYPIRQSQVPAGISTKSYVHYAQMSNSGGRFQYYDYGRKKNLEYYHSEVPPEYQIKNVVTPVYLMYADTDFSAHEKDVEYLYDVLPERTKIYGKFRIANFNHGGFFYGAHVVDYVYKPVLVLLNKIYGPALN